VFADSTQHTWRRREPRVQNVRVDHVAAPFEALKGLSDCAEERSAMKAGGRLLKWKMKLPVGASLDSSEKL
jgi:hypothetical protein